MSADESTAWEKWRVDHIREQLPGFMKSIERLSRQQLDDNQQYILQEIQLWLESIAPSDMSDADSPD
jgi:hypothetical protein